MSSVMVDIKPVDLLKGKDPSEFCHLVNESEPFPLEMITLCGEKVTPADYEPNSKWPPCPICQQLAMYWSTSA